MKTNKMVQYATWNSECDEDCGTDEDLKVGQVCSCGVGAWQLFDSIEEAVPSTETVEVFKMEAKSMGQYGRQAVQKVRPPAKRMAKK